MIFQILNRWGSTSCALVALIAMSCGQGARGQDGSKPQDTATQDSEPPQTSIDNGKVLLELPEGARDPLAKESVTLGEERVQNAEAVRNQAADTHSRTLRYPAKLQTGIALKSSEVKLSKERAALSLARFKLKGSGSGAFEAISSGEKGYLIGCTFAPAPKVSADDIKNNRSGCVCAETPAGQSCLRREAEAKRRYEEDQRVRAELAKQPKPMNQSYRDGSVMGLPFDDAGKVFVDAESAASQINTTQFDQEASALKDRGNRTYSTISTPLRERERQRTEDLRRQSTDANEDPWFDDFFKPFADSWMQQQFAGPDDEPEFQASEGAGFPEPSPEPEPEPEPEPQLGAYSSGSSGPCHVGHVESAHPGGCHGTPVPSN